MARAPVMRTNLPLFSSKTTLMVSGRVIFLCPSSKALEVDTALFYTQKKYEVIENLHQGAI